MEIKRIEQLLGETQRILAHQRKIEELKGEKFNVFSILKMESKENGTHSAFLCELLNPKGSHLKGAIFLKLFIDVIKNSFQNLDTNQDVNILINPETSEAKVEHSIGQINENDKTGGRIDIYIWDKNEYRISIENKIYAGDQNVQIERYCNYKKKKNMVFYLTLEGKEPTEISKGKLKANTDFFIISYKVHIQEWLEKCMKEVYDSPILRETIKQYLILIKKLTQTMNEIEKEGLLDVFLRNPEEASVIAANFKSTICSFLEKIRQKTFNELKNKLNNKYIVNLGNSPDKSYSQIWIRIAGKEENKISFGIQSFAFEKDSIEDLFIGIFAFNGKYLSEYEKTWGEKVSNWWITIQKFSAFKDYKIKFSDFRTLQKLQDMEFQNEFINHIVNETISYLDTHYDSVKSFLN